MNSIKSANQVLQRTSEYLQSGLVESQPAWYKVLAHHPPRHAFNKKVRLDVLKEIKGNEKNEITSIQQKVNNFYQTRLKPSQFKANLLKPQKLKFIEDDLRELFYKQHPWELADPKNLIENEHTIDADDFDWSHLRQFTKKLDGESVVQRTLYLIENENLELLEAYEQAKFEYYSLKIEDETELNVSKEESEMFGAVYPKSIVASGFDKEAEVLEKWKIEAIEQTKILEAKMNADASGNFQAAATEEIEEEFTEADFMKDLEKNQ